MVERILTGLVLCSVFAVVPLGQPRASALPIHAPQGDGASCTVGEKCAGDCGCRAGCSITCGKGQTPKCEAAYEKKGLCYDAKCYCVKGPRSDNSPD